MSHAKTATKTRNKTRTTPRTNTAHQAPPKRRATTATEAPSSPPAAAQQPPDAQQLQDIVRGAVRDAIALEREQTRTVAPLASPETDPFGRKAEKATNQFTVRLTERENALLERARRPDLWNGETPSITTVLRRLAWEGARVRGLLSEGADGAP